MREQLVRVLKVFSGRVDATVDQLATAASTTRVIVEALIEPLILLGVLVKDGDVVQLAYQPQHALQLVKALVDAAESEAPAIPDFASSDTASSSWVNIVREIDKWRVTAPSRHVALTMVLIVGKDPRGERWVLCRVDTRPWKELKLPMGKVEFWPLDREHPILETKDAHVEALTALSERFRREFFLNDMSQYLRVAPEPFTGFNQQEGSATTGLRSAYHLCVYPVAEYMPNRFPYPAGSTLAWLHRDKLDEILKGNFSKMFFPDGAAGELCLLEIDGAKSPYLMEDVDLAHVVTDSILEELVEARRKREGKDPALS